jgi:peptidyl-prolyl cis-trans isomerase SurA
MKKIIAVLALALALAPAAAPAGGQEVVEEIVAIVNDDIITLSEFRFQYELSLADLRSRQMTPEQYAAQLAQRKENFLEAMITELLLLQKARELGMNVAEQVKAMVEKIKQENNFSSDQDLRRAVEQQGITYDQWLKQYEEGMMRQGVLYTEVERAIVLDDSEVIQYYKKNPADFTLPTEFTLSAIYLATGTRTAEECEALKAEVDAKLKSGASFADTAAELSDEPMKEAKGDLGSFKEGELERTLESAVEKLKAGETAAWVSTANGWYLLRLTERKDSHVLPFDEARGQVEEKIYAEKRAVKGEAYLKSLRERSYIKILNPDPFEK